MDAESLLSTLTYIFINKGAAREVAILSNATADLIQTESDNWDGGTYGYSFYVKTPLELYVQITEAKNEIESAIHAAASPLFSDNEYLQKCVIDPIPTTDPNWREKARTWLAGSGVNNQGAGTLRQYCFA
jgi:hypothetical protein